MEKDIRYASSDNEDLAFLIHHSREPSNANVIKVLQAHNILKELRRIKKLAEFSVTC